MHSTSSTFRTQHIRPSHLAMASYLTLLLNSDPAIFDVPTKFLSSLTHAPSLDSAIPIAVRIVLVGAAVAALRRAATYFHHKCKRGVLISPLPYRHTDPSISHFPNSLHFGFRRFLSLGDGLDRTRPFGTKTDRTLSALHQSVASSQKPERKCSSGK